MFYALTAFVGVFTVGITAVLIVLGLKYKAEPGRKSEHVESLKLELIWSAIPAVIALVIFAWGAVIYFDYSQDAPKSVVNNLVKILESFKPAP